MSRLDWMVSGDRSHINLVQLDSLNLVYPGWGTDVAKAEDIHTNHPIEFEEKLFEIQEKQKMFSGNRSHTRLVSLDLLTLTYPDWQRDARKAEFYHVCLPDLFYAKIDGMKEKQRMYDGDRSHRNLQALDAMSLSYPGFEDDVMNAEKAHTSKPFLFADKLHEIEMKQQLFQGDRSHPRLKELDGIHLTYPDWQRDFSKAEEYHAKYPDLFDGKIDGMREKQKMHLGDRTHSNLVKLDTLILSYTFWREDFEKAEDAHTHNPLEFDSRLFLMEEKQRMYDGIRIHPRLISMDSIQFNYPNWERDFLKAEEYHVRFPELFKGKLSGMKEKQRIYSGTAAGSKPAAPASAIIQNTAPQDKKSLEDKSECIICLVNQKTHAFVPCGHMCVCQNCVAKTMDTRRCPICRQMATQAIRVFFS